jgi:DNA-binding protein Fis
MSMSAALDSIAREAIDQLGIAEVLDRERESLRSHLHQCDELAASNPMESEDLVFISLALPILNALLQYATSRQRLADAIAWVRRNRPDDEEIDPLATLAALMLAYVVRTAVREAKTEWDKKEWLRIYHRVERLIDAS